MTNEIIPPDTQPPVARQSIGFIGSLMSAVGIGLMMLTMVGSAGAATVWAFGKLLGFPDWLTLPFYALVAALVLWITVWATGRAWHVERLLERGQDVDVPVFKALYYFQKNPKT